MREVGKVGHVYREEFYLYVYAMINRIRSLLSEDILNRFFEGERRTFWKKITFSNWIKLSPRTFQFGGVGRIDPVENVMFL